jgi:hypothetical protein
VEPTATVNVIEINEALANQPQVTGKLNHATEPKPPDKPSEVSINVTRLTVSQKVDDTEPTLNPKPQVTPTNSIITALSKPTKHITRLILPLTAKKPLKLLNPTQPMTTTPTLNAPAKELGILINHLTHCNTPNPSNPSHKLINTTRQTTTTPITTTTPTRQAINLKRTTTHLCF